jgi:hypothetical protein
MASWAAVSPAVVVPVVEVAAEAVAAGPVAGVVVAAAVAGLAVVVVAGVVAAVAVEAVVVEAAVAVVAEAAVEVLVVAGLAGREPVGDIVVAEKVVGEWSAARPGERCTAAFAALELGRAECRIVHRRCPAGLAEIPAAVVPAAVAPAAVVPVVAYPAARAARGECRTAAVAHRVDLGVAYLAVPVECRIVEPVGLVERPAVVAECPVGLEPDRQPPLGETDPRPGDRTVDSYRAAWVFGFGIRNLYIETCSYALALSRLTHFATTLALVYTLPLSLSTIHPRTSEISTPRVAALCLDESKRSPG